MSATVITQDEINKCHELRAKGCTLKQIKEHFGWKSENSVNFRLARTPNVPIEAPPPPKPDPEPETKPEKYRLGGDAKDREVIRLKDEVKRLENELKAAHRDALDEDAIRQIVGTLASAPARVPSWVVTAAPRSANKTPEIPVTSWADWHAGEVVSREQVNGVNEFNLEILEARVRRLVERTISLAKEHGPGAYPGVVVNLVGDFVSGGLHPELLKTDEENVLQATLRVRDLLVWGLTQMADHFGQVYAPAVCGNHGRQTHKPEFKDYVYKNFDWLIYQMVKRAFEDRGDKRVVIDTRPANEVYYSVYGQRYLLMHGDQMGVKGGDGIIGSLGPIARGEVKVRGWADSSKIPYDILVMGHWHQGLWLPRAIVSNTLKGFCDYAKNALRAPITAPSQPLWFVHPRYGITSRWEVKVDAPAAVAKDVPWVSVFDPGKAA